METNVQKKQSPASPSRTPYRGGGASRGGRPGGSRDGSRGGNRTFERPRPEFEQKIVAIRRVTRVVSGGRRMSFAVALAIGDKKAQSDSAQERVTTLRLRSTKHFVWQRKIFSVLIQQKNFLLNMVLMQNTVVQ